MSAGHGLSSSVKMSIGVAIVVVAIMVAIIMSVVDGDTGGASDDARAAPTTGTGAPAAPAGPAGQTGPAGQAGRSGSVGPAGPTHDADEPSSADTPLAGMVLPWLSGDGAVDVGSYLAGTPSVVNLWAYWCAPCREELPAMAQFAQQAAGEVNVLTVHSDARPSAGEDLLTELGVDLPAVEDEGRRVATAVQAPPVLPVTILLRADGTVAKVVVNSFDDPDDIAETVSEHLGVNL